MGKKTFFANDDIRVYPLNKSLETRWFVRYKLPDGKRREMVVFNYFSVGEREGAAQEIIKKIKANPLNPLEKPIFQAATVKTEKLYEMINSRVGQLEKKTIQSYTSHVNNLDTFCKSQKFRFITPEVAQKFIDHLRAKKYSEVTIRKHQITLKILFKRLVDTKVIRKNPFVGIENAKGVSESRGYFRVAQLEKIKIEIANKYSELLPACEYLYYLLCRPKELRLIKIEDVNFDNWTIKIKWNVGKNTGSKQNRFCVIPNALKDLMIARNIENYPPNYFLIGNTGLPGVAPVAINFWSARMTKILRAMGFSKEYTLYSLKNTGAIAFYKAGIGLVEIQKQIGHRDINTTIIYLRSMGFDDFENVRLNVPTF